PLSFFAYAILRESAPDGSHWDNLLRLEQAGFPVNPLRARVHAHGVEEGGREEGAEGGRDGAQGADGAANGNRVENGKQVRDTGAEPETTKEDGGGGSGLVDRVMAVCAHWETLRDALPY